MASIRRAVPADAAVLAELGTATFVETFGHLYAPTDLQAFLEESHSIAAYEQVLADASGYALWIAECDGRAIGYAQAGPCGLPHTDVRPEDGEIKRLYLRREAQSGGVGRALMDAAMAWLLHDGPRTLWLSVWSENFGAQRFYARYGFAFVGEYEFIVGDQRDREFIYRRVAQA
ncbi:MAG: GNAT family N-acetyltransferase [Thermomonas sp.]|uniref:GNAT family N-acetyltransferase n=1 Tax=Thermomonas sp. TaxID=1971895 RepID=UPI00260B8A9F|nr:GNAT family N-acetyltransferase [Thermomonas sp.]MCC7095862.1 GNAT family N-acetyltransferase [Thermomonas sp.]